MAFCRERRYIVLKLKDVNAALTPTEGRILGELCGKIAEHREQAGRGDLICAVVEKDWPEYETVWQAIQRRVEGSVIGGRNENRQANRGTAVAILEKLVEEIKAGVLAPESISVSYPAAYSFNATEYLIRLSKTSNDIQPPTDVPAPL